MPAALWRSRSFPTTSPPPHDRPQVHGDLGVNVLEEVRARTCDYCQVKRDVLPRRKKLSGISNETTDYPARRLFLKYPKDLKLEDRIAILLVV
jgi:hypothetical protein